MKVLEKIAESGNVEVVKINKKKNFVNDIYHRNEGSYVFLAKKDNKRSPVIFRSAKFEDLKDFVKTSLKKTDL